MNFVSLAEAMTAPKGPTQSPNAALRQKQNILKGSAVTAVDKMQGDGDVVPFLVGMAEPRVPSQIVPGAYCAQAKQWVVQTSEGAKPIISVRSGVAETETKTRVQHEVDDEQFGGLLELETKTKVVQEVDDEDIHQLLALRTKTFVDEEVDDDARVIGLLELETKTQAECEHDDDSHPIC